MDSKDKIKQFIKEKFGIDKTNGFNLCDIPTDDLRLAADVENRLLIVGYLTLDNDVEWDEDDQGKIEEFRSGHERDNYIKKIEKSGKKALIVNRYKHSTVHYSVKGTRLYPDMQWDVAPCAVYTFPKEIQEEINSGKRTEAEAINFANSALDVYSKWCNGETYGVIVEKINVDTGEKTSDPVYGFIGRETALFGLEENFGLMKTVESSPKKR